MTSHAITYNFIIISIESITLQSVTGRTLALNTRPVRPASI